LHSAPNKRLFNGGPPTFSDGLGKSSILRKPRSEEVIYLGLRQKEEGLRGQEKGAQRAQIQKVPRQRLWGNKKFPFRAQ
jgi:hypothetical protein